MPVVNGLLWVLVIVTENSLTLQAVVLNNELNYYPDLVERDRSSTTGFTDGDTGTMADQTQEHTQEGQGDNKGEELLTGGLSPEVLAQLAEEVPDIELDLSSNKKKLISGLGNSLPFAPMVNHLRGVGQAAAILPQQGALPQGNNQGQGQGNAQGQQVQGRGQVNQGQGQGVQPPPRRYVLEDGDVAYGDNTQTMLC